MRRRLLLAGPLLAAGCSTPPQTALLRGAGGAHLPRRWELDAVPFFAQTRDHCGPAALATVLAHLGLPADPERLADAVFLPGRGGSLQLEMLSGARRAGAVATRVPGQMDALLRELVDGNPVLLLQNRGLAWMPVWHYAVLVGYDLDAEELLLRSGELRRERISLRTFERTWARAGHWAVVLLPPERLSATAGEAESLQAAIGFERVAPPARAAQAYASLLARWPGNLPAAIGLGNTLRAAGDLAGAADALRAAAARHDSAMAWINLAELERSRGKVAAARQAAQQALRRARSAEPRWLALAEQQLKDLTPEESP